MLQSFPANYIQPLLCARAAGIRTSVMILKGIGGRALSEQHALASARLVNETRPDYLATLVLKGVLGRDKARLLQQIDESIVYFGNYPEFEHGHSQY